MSALYYSAFGQRLESSIPFPELRPIEPGPARWSFQLVDRLREPSDLELLGEERIYGAVSARFFRHSDGYRIVVDDTGAYDLSGGGRDISWQPNEEPWWDFGRSHLVGRVLATALHLSGVATLHGSGVQLAGGVVGFLAPKHVGKSTLAMMLFRAGGRFVTDDALPVAGSDPILAFPGIQSLRVRQGDEQWANMWDGARPTEGGRDGKLFLPPFPDDRILLERAPLDALYLLVPRTPDPGAPAVRRVRLPEVLATMRLLSQFKIGEMLGSRFAGQLLDVAASIAAAVPVFELSVQRDLQRLPEVVDQLMEWHGGPIATTAGAHV